MWSNARQQTQSYHSLHKQKASFWFLCYPSPYMNGYFGLLQLFSGIENASMIRPISVSALLFLGRLMCIHCKPWLDFSCLLASDLLFIRYYSCNLYHCAFVLILICATSCLLMRHQDRPFLTLMSCPHFKGSPESTSLHLQCLGCSHLDKVSQRGCFPPGRYSMAKS